ncbi:MAG: flagellar basal body L-ring protein FlgH [Thermodesulfobacteriota bacterium]|nr:flagellar basal body L-ring protein FlgH [Thermodesulfobacteriota bacterium]
MSPKYRLLAMGESLFLFFVSFVSFPGCATNHQPLRPTQEPFNHGQVSAEPQVKHEASLWQENGPLSELFINAKARRVGDIVTIKVAESSKASNNADTTTGRKSSISAGLDNFFGLEKDHPSSDPFFNPFGEVKGDFESGFDGKGTTSRSGDLTAYITARVTEVLPNGNLRILGSKEVAVNNERQFITLSGIIRPRDISPNNVVLSTYISDASIAYSGMGIINERQRPGWMTRMMNTVWPF